jgi:hypothetical protein
LTPDYSGFNYAEYFTVWIDLDDDGAFENPAELIFDAGQAVSGTLTGTLTVPADSPNGPKRMRVVMKYNTAPVDGCADGYDYGETEDYCVTLQSADAISEPPGGDAVALYPNPAVQEITFDLNASADRDGVVQILDNTGRILLRQRLQNGRAVVNTGNMASGSYLFHLVSGRARTFRGTFQVQREH